MAFGTATLAAISLFEAFAEHTSMTIMTQVSAGDETVFRASTSGTLSSATPGCIHAHSVMQSINGSFGSVGGGEAAALDH